jgi:hypothetical protein
MSMEVESHSLMDTMYEKILGTLSGILEPAPQNQLGMPDYCRYILGILAESKKMIEELEDLVRTMLRSYDTIDEEF